MKIDENDAPDDGCRAVEYDWTCAGCVLLNKPECARARCFAEQRKDRCAVKFVRRDNTAPQSLAAKIASALSAECADVGRVEKIVAGVLAAEGVR
jgi:hypothetical protein